MITAARLPWALGTCRHRQPPCQSVVQGAFGQRLASGCLPGRPESRPAAVAGASQMPLNLYCRMCLDIYAERGAQSRTQMFRPAQHAPPRWQSQVQGQASTTQCCLSTKLVLPNGLSHCQMLAVRLTVRLAEQHLNGGSKNSRAPALTGPPSVVGGAEAGLAAASLALKAALAGWDTGASKAGAAELRWGRRWRLPATCKQST